jgi:hypothetical protein
MNKYVSSVPLATLLVTCPVDNSILIGSAIYPFILDSTINTFIIRNEFILCCKHCLLSSKTIAHNHSSHLERQTPYQSRRVGKLDNGSALAATCQMSFLCVIYIVVFIWKGSGKKGRRPIHEFSHRSRAMGPEPKKISTWNLECCKR